MFAVADGEVQRGPSGRERDVFRLDRARTRPQFAKMMLHRAPAFVNNVDTDATPITGWGRRRTRA
jgi:hypothetical protein